MPGIARINLTPLTQKIIGCVIGENVTTEYPWVYVKKEDIEDNLDLHDESSDFLPVRDHISLYPDKNILIGYSPTSDDEGQFYICLTEAGRDAVIKSIEALRIDQENRVRNAVYKIPRTWQDLGSGQEVDDAIVKNTRPLFEIEVETTLDLLKVPIKLTDRNADDQRDGYVELLPYRQSFDNVTKKIASKGIQTGLALRENNAQTTPTMLVNSWFQYRYDHKPINPNTYDEEKKSAMKKFLDKYTDDLCDEASQNATWDIYTDDCSKLVRRVRDTLAPIPIAYTEHQSYYDGKLTNDRVINDLCWHPFWTGVAVAAYTEYCKSDRLTGLSSLAEVLPSTEMENQVLVWSFNDCLTPKLILECSREVTAISICPLDGNVVVGGCTSGQIAIWTIPGKIEEVETIVINTAAQVKYRTALKPLMSWMKGFANSSIIQAAAMSSMRYSQRGPITQIVWFPAYNRIDKNGRIESLPEDTAREELSWQFATSSEDGTIAFWDLRLQPPEEKEKTGSRNKKKRKTIKRPEALLQSISPFKSFDGLFRPFYMLEVRRPGEEKPVVITTMSIHNPILEKKLDNPKPNPKDDNVGVRKYYKLENFKPDYDLEPFIFIGTVDGYVARLSWEGYEFSTGVFVNHETSKFEWQNSIHDGPVTHAVRSKYLKDVILTVGGNIFAVWREDFEEPVIWKKCKVRYTACCWGTFRPTVVILARVDGTAEIWDFIVKTHEPSFTQGLSGRIITGIYTHELYLNPQCVAFCDYNGTLRVFTAPPDLLTFDAGDIKWMRKYVDREIDRIRQFKRWQMSKNEANLDAAEKRKREADIEAEKKQREAEAKVKIPMDQMNTEKLERTPKKSDRSGKFLEDARLQWKAMVLERMQRVILEKKGLREDVLERRRAPYLKLRQDAKKKKRKIREIMQLQDQIFEETMAFLFPEQYYYDRPETKIIQLPEIDETDDTTLTLKKVLEELPKARFKNPEEQIIYDFMETQSEALAEMRANPYEPDFDWRKVLSEGKMRRKSMDVALKWNAEQNEPHWTDETQ
ncbi:dynein axonemal intermediate chain 3-like [Venturia canescens]|uniref:dynein axonemal intermediate chain 3-like n=1 Tax=Venturia canescens TaxID=32260 RepID=UPI001C9C56E5|nr:dynein axonemal intermediate chain 3-like [Venturia canescens]